MEISLFPQRRKRETRREDGAWKRLGSGAREPRQNEDEQWLQEHCVIACRSGLEQTR